MINLNKIYEWRPKNTLIAVLVALLVVVFGMTMFTESPSKEPQTIFGNIKLSDDEGEPKKKEYVSNYEQIRNEKAYPQKDSLAYKVKVKKENPLLPLYREANEKPASPIQIEKVAPKKKKKPVDEDANQKIFSYRNEELHEEKQFYEAVFRDAQQVQNGKALKIILKEPIPALNLSEGTVLKGVPSCYGDRIIITITAGVVDKNVFKVDLECYDKEDCLPGLYHDQLAKHLEESTRDSAVDELLDFDFKGNRIARKTNTLTYIPHLKL
jgi:hypothetical protein